MISPKTPKKIPTPTNDLVAQLRQLGLVVTADSLDDLVARASTGRWSPRQLLEAIARSETEAAARRPDAIPLGPIRSLHYFLPLIEELLHTPLHHGDTYLAYLRSKVPLRPAADRATPAAR